VARPVPDQVDVWKAGIKIGGIRKLEIAPVFPLKGIATKKP
jgi:hypothetical protein